MNIPPSPVTSELNLKNVELFNKSNFTPPYTNPPVDVFIHY